MVEIILGVITSVLIGFSILTCLRQFGFKPSFLLATIIIAPFQVIAFKIMMS